MTQQKRSNNKYYASAYIYIYIYKFFVLIWTQRFIFGNILCFVYKVHIFFQIMEQFIGLEK